MHRTIRAFLPAMLETGHGSIVKHLVLPPACSKAAPNRYVYGATKAAVAALTPRGRHRLHHQGHTM